MGIEIKINKGAQEMTEQTKQRLKDALIEHKSIAASEYNDEDAFVGIYFNDLVDIIDSVAWNEDWHPVSESPTVPEHYNWVHVIAIVCDMDDNSIRATDATFNKDKGWIFPEFSRVLWWRYPPKEEK